MSDRRSFIKRSMQVCLLATMPWPLSAMATQHGREPLLLTGRMRPTLVGDNFNLLKEAADAFMDMRSDASKVGIDMYSQSSYRSYEHQRGIWNRKYKRYTDKGMSPSQASNEIIKYSTIPGTSRHHWGTDLDIVDRTMAYPADPLHEKHYRKGGTYEKLHHFLTKKASDYGFYLVYTNEKARKGFHYEPWHFSYKPLSKVFLENYRQIGWKKIVRSDGELLGHQHLNDEFLIKYEKENILDINPVLLP